MRALIVNDLEMNDELGKLAKENIRGGHAGGVAVGRSFAAAYAVGKKIDETFNVSDKVSDKAIEEFGPAPRWLQYLF